MESESLGFLLIDLMFYYGFTFDYTTSYISSATSPGILLPKPEESEILSIRCLLNPGSFSSFLRVDLVRSNHWLPENEIAKSVSKVGAFFQFFKDAYSALLRLDLTNQNILGQIIRIDQKVWMPCFSHASLWNNDFITVFGPACTSCSVHSTVQCNERTSNTSYSFCQSSSASTPVI